MEHRKKRWAALVLALALLLCCGCIPKSQAALLADARQYMARLSVENCDYRILRSSDGALIQRCRSWSSANLPAYPGGTVVLDGEKAYFCKDSSGFTLSEADGGVPRDDPGIEELPGFSFDAYDRAAERLLDLLREAMEQKELLEPRYNTEHVTISDYLYFDFTEAFLTGEALREVTGQVYDGGFLSFLYQGDGQKANSCGVVLYRYAADGETELRDSYTYMDPNGNNGYVVTSGG